MQKNRRAVEIIDHEIETPIAIEIADREPASGPRIRERTSRRRADPLKLAVQIPKQQRLLRVTRAPLMRIDLRVHVTVHHKQIQPAIVVVIDKARAPTEKRNRHFTQTGLKSYVSKIRVAVVVIEHVR